MSIIDKPIVKTLMLKGEKGEKGDPGDLDSTAIVDNLTTNRADKVLSAKQGKVLNDKIDDVNAIKPSMYDTVALMKADTDLIDGDYAQTLGYYSANDGGGATYKITTTESQTEYQEELDSGLYATLTVNDYITPEQLGAYGDNIHDDTTIIQNVIDKFNNVVMTKNYLVTELNIKGNVKSTGIINGNIKINTSDVNFNFNRINGTLIVEADKLIQLVNINGKRLINENGIGLSLISNSGYGIQYCNFSIWLIRANKCINFDSTNGGWINNNYFYKTNVSYGTGITSENLSGNSSYNGNTFSEFGFEDITKWFNLNYFTETLIEKCRMIPFEAAGQGTSIRELGTLNNSKSIYFNNEATGTYYQYLTLTNSTIKLNGRIMKNDGVVVGTRMNIANETIRSVLFDNEIFYKNMSDLTSSTQIQIYNYDVTKPIIFNYDESKYTYVNLAIPDDIAQAIKYVDIVIKGTMSNSMTVTRNNVLLKEIPSGTENTTLRLYL